MAERRTSSDENPDRSAFILRVFRYLEKNLSTEELAGLQSELESDPLKQDLFVELCLTRQSMVQLFRSRAQFQKQSQANEFQADERSFREPARESSREPARVPTSTDLADAMILPAVSEDQLDEEVPVEQGPAALPTRIEPRWWQKPWQNPWVKAAAIAIPVIGLPLFWHLSHSDGPRQVADDSARGNVPNVAAAPVAAPTSDPTALPSGNSAVAVIKSPTPVKQPPPTELAVRPAPVVEKPVPATLELALDARWDGGKADFQLHEQIPLGPHSLNRGTVLIKLAGGATMLLQAPADFEVKSQNRVALSRGQLSGSVPHTSAGLTVQTPDMTAVDLGTEFGVDVTPHENTHLEVFDGRVQATPRSAAQSATEPSSTHATGASNHVTSDLTPSAASSTTLPTVLTANQAVEADAGSNALASAAPTPLEFMRTQELIDCTAPGGNIGLARWKAFSSVLRNDPDLVGYYTFDPTPGDPLKLTNQSVATAGTHDGQLGVPGTADSIPGWNVGRWPGKGALQFGDTMNTVVRIPNDAQLIPAVPFSYMVWLKRQDMARPVHLINAVTGDTRCFDLSLIGTEGEKKPVREADGLYLDMGPGAKAAQVQAQGVGKVLPPVSKWFLLVVTVDAKAITHVYVDGKLRGQFSLVVPKLSRTGELWIGRPNPAAKDMGRNLILRGWIDELAIFRRVLSAREIQRIYQAGRPD
jgi:hypothetical protein